MFFKIDILKNFAMFTGKHLCWSLFLIKTQSFKACNISKKRLQNRYFPVNIAKFLRKSFFIEYLRWLLFNSLSELTAVTRTVRLNAYSHCTKNEEILNRKLHFFCSVRHPEHHILDVIWTTVEYNGSH